MSIVVPGPIGKNGGIQQFSAAGTLPCIERTDKIIKLLSEHATLATWTMHRIPPDYRNELRQEGNYILCANSADYLFSVTINFESCVFQGV